MYGFHGRLLRIDLTTQSYTWQDIEASRLAAVLGGVGLGASLLYEYAPPRVEPFAAENPLIFTSAPLVGTGLTTTAKYAVVTKSPLTGFIAGFPLFQFFCPGAQADRSRCAGDYGRVRAARISSDNGRRESSSERPPI